MARRALLACSITVAAKLQVKATSQDLTPALGAASFDRLYSDVFNDLINLREVLQQQGQCNAAHLVIWATAALDVEDDSVDQISLELG